MLFKCAVLVLVSTHAQRFEQWRVLTFPFRSALFYDNPFADVSFTVSFSRGNTTITRPGFWDGGSSFAARFAAPALGTWAWRSFCTNPADPGLHNVSGSFEVIPYASGVNPLYAHGPLRVRADGRRFEHADGTPFRWLGDTMWMAPDLVLLHSCNAPANASCTSALRYIIDDRVRKGFTVYQTYYFGETGTWWLDPGNYTRLNASAFDVVVGAANEAGLAVALGMGMHSMSQTVPLSALRALASYTSARYGAHSIVWITAQEVNAPNANATAWGVAAEALFDGSRELGVPLSAHMWVGTNETHPFDPPFVYGDRPFHSWFATQGGHTGMGVRSKSHYASYWDWRSPLTGAPAPFLEAEAMYENITCGPRYAWANDTRAAAWKATLCGSLGFTYGGAAIWLFKRDVEDQTGEPYNPGTWWWPNVALPGSAQVGLMSLALGPGGLLGDGWAQLSPRFSDPAWCDFGAEDETTVLATVADEVFVVYAYGAARDVGSVRGLRAAPAAYRASLLDPRTGAVVDLGSVTADAGGAWRVPTKLDGADWAWVLVLQQPAPADDAATDDDVDTVRARILTELIWAPGSPLATPADATAWGASLIPSNGTWPDIVYNDRDDRTIWKAAAHTARVQALAAAVAQPGHALYRDAAAFATARRALAGWLALDPPNTNWWWIILQSPQTLSASYLLLSLVGDVVAPAFPTSAELALGLHFMYRAAWWDTSLGYEVTGANLGWMMQVQLTRGVLPTAVNASALAQGFARLWEEVKVANDTSEGQGIQVDGSYHMHNAQLQVLSYGQDFVEEVLLFSTVAAGTVYAMPSAPAGILCEYIANGMAWLTNGRAIDWAAGGRQVARPGAASQMLVNLNLTRLDALAGACPDAPTGAAVAAYAARVRGDAGAPALHGNWHFFASDHMTHRRPGWAANLHMRSQRTRSPECGNGENLRGEHMGNGLLNLVGEGGGADAGGVAEYADVFPLLDWHELNGVTADCDVPVPACADVANCCWQAEVVHNSTAWVGGASDGTFGVAVMDTRTHAFSSRRAWFFLDRAVVALTADASDVSASSVRTTLASRLLRGAVAGGFENGTMAPELPWANRTLPLGGADGLAWLAAVGHAWLPWLPAAGPPPAAGAAYSAGRRCGEWQYIGAYTGTICNDTLTLALEHGAGALRDAKFGYALLPNVSAAEAPAAAAAARSLAIANGGAVDGGVQAVADAGARVALAAFWAPAGGAVSLGAGGAWPITLAANSACLAVYSEDGVGGAALAVSAPMPGGQVVAITVDRALAASDGCPATPAPGGGSTLVAHLPPAGNFQGQSFVFHCKLNKRGSR